MLSIVTAPRTAVALFAYCVFGVLWPAGVVLCIGGEGHVAVEYADAGCCAHPAQSTAAASSIPQVTAPSRSDHTCAHCLDIPLSVGDHVQQAPDFSPPGGAPAALTVADVGAQPSGRLQRPGAWHRAPRWVDRVRTVVLTC